MRTFVGKEVPPISFQKERVNNNGLRRRNSWWSWSRREWQRQVGPSKQHLHERAGCGQHQQLYHQVPIPVLEEGSHDPKVLAMLDSIKFR